MRQGLGKGEAVTQRASRITPDSGAAFPMRLVKYNEIGRPYVERPSKKVDGSVVSRRRYGTVLKCQECDVQFLAVNKRQLGYCSRRCAKRDKPNVKLMTLSGMRMRADKMFSLAVRSRGSCERCGESQYKRLQCAHIMSRQYIAVRWDWSNALCLCAGCHYWGHAHPLEWDDFVIGKMGEDAYYELRRRARQVVQMRQESYLVLFGRLEALLADCGVAEDEVASRVFGMKVKAS